MTMSQESNNNRILKNTLTLYVRMFVTLLVGLYTSRVVLASLGFSDYGLYNVVGGVVAIFSFLNGALSTSTQRFLNFELGKTGKNKLSVVFSTALLQHLLLAIVIILLAETIGYWFVVEKLNITSGRETAAQICYQFSIIAICINVLQLPFMSAIVAHEKMDVYAYVSIFDVIAKLVIAYLIQISDLDKLILYSFLILCVYVFDCAVYVIYSIKKFPEVHLSCHTEKTLFKEMLSFSGWNVIGMLASTLNNYGLNILFNIFFGTVVNAARAIAYQVNGLVNQFSNNFQLAVKPQIIKYYANEEKEKMTHLVCNSAKYSAMLLLVFAIPLVLEIEYLLHLWLGIYPSHAPNMVRIVLIHSVIISMIGPILMAVHATGKLKMVGVTAGIFNLLLLPINYGLLRLGVSPEIAMLINVLGSIVETFIELCWLRYYIGFSIGLFYKNVYIPVFGMGIMMFLFPTLVRCGIDWNNEMYRFLVVSVLSISFSCCLIYMLMLPAEIKTKIKTKIKLG